MTLFFMIFFGILVAPLAVAISYIFIKLLVQTLVMLYVEAFSVMGWEAPRHYVSYHWGW